MAITSHAWAKLAKSRPSVSVSTSAAIPTSASWLRNGLGSARAPDPTPGTGGVGQNGPPFVESARDHTGLAQPTPPSLPHARGGRQRRRAARAAAQKGF